MSEGVRADSADAILQSLGQPYDTTAVVDRFMLYFEILEGTEDEIRGRFWDVMGTYKIGSHDNQVFVELCGDPTWGITQGSQIPGVRFDHIWWFGIATTVTVPVGSEPEWAQRIRPIPGVRWAEPDAWCPE